MKKLLLFCFLVSGGLMAMKDADIITDLAKKVTLDLSHFAQVDKSGHTTFNIAELAIDTLTRACKNQDDEFIWDNIKGVINSVADFSFQYGDEQGFNAGYTEAKRKFLKSLYDSGPKKACLAIVTLIVVSSVAHAGFSLFAKFKKCRKKEDTK
jgi:hypothetical protein